MSYVYEKTVVCVRCRSVTYLMNDQKVSPEQRKGYLCETCNEEANEDRPVAETTPLPCSRPLTPITPMINARVPSLQLPSLPKSANTSESTIPASRSSAKSSSSSSFSSKVSKKIFTKKSKSNSSKSSSMSSISDFVKRLKDEFRSSGSSKSTSKSTSKRSSSQTSSSSSSKTSSSDFQSRQKRAIPLDFQDDDFRMVKREIPLDFQEEDFSTIKTATSDQKIVPEPIEIENSNLTEVCQYDEIPVGETHWPEQTEIIEPTDLENPQMWPDTPRPAGPNQFLAPNAGLRARCGCIHPTLDAEGLKQLELQNERKKLKVEMQRELQEQVPCQMMGSGMMVNRNRMMMPCQTRARMVGNLMVGSSINYPCMMPAFYAGGSGNRASPANSYHGPYTYSNPANALPQSGLPQNTNTPSAAFLSRNSSVNHFARPQPLANCQHVGSSSPILFHTQTSCNCHTRTPNLCTARRFSDKSVPSNYYSNHKPLQQTFYDQPRSHCMAHTMQTALKNGCVLHGGMIAGKVIKNSAEN